jgi:hypothetical protein
MTAAERRAEFVQRTMQAIRDAGILTRAMSGSS